MYSSKPGIAKDLTEADEIGRKAVVDFIDSLLVANLSFTSRFNATSKKHLRLAKSRTRNRPNHKTSSAVRELKGTSLVSMAFFLLDIVLTLSS